LVGAQPKTEEPTVSIPPKPIDRAEAKVSITKIFSGAFSDWLGRRKGLAGLGYGLAAISKWLFPLASDVSLPEDGVALPLGESD